jgi:hypothetical protein
MNERMSQMCIHQRAKYKHKILFIHESEGEINFSTFKTTTEESLNLLISLKE